jgi:NADPH:quinone reductase-like Zn-dependent oxidoreductase
MPNEAKNKAMADITEFLSMNRLDNRIAATYPLDEVAKAHLAIEKGGNNGSVILTL